jgi:hypothetical protein
VNQPLIDAQLLRQCQTAFATREMLREPGLPVSTIVPWRGDSGAKLVQEVPTYNYLVIGVNSVVRNLDMSRKDLQRATWRLNSDLETIATLEPAIAAYNKKRR